ncbi:hypothetical protein ABIE73_004174 [Bradyrhizobium yuanmingense]
MQTMIPPSAQVPFRIRDATIHGDFLDMTSLASTTDIQPIRPSALSAKLAMALLLAGLADWLFYGQRIGLSLALFAIATACVSLLFNHAALDWRRAMISGAIVAAGLAPAVEELNTLSFLILVASLTIALLLATNPDTTGVTDRARALCNFLLVGPFRLFLEAPQMFNMSAFTRGIALWLMPAALSTVFIALFAAANPVIEQWVSLLNPKVIFNHVNMWRVLFWTLMLALVWPFIHVRWRRRAIVAAAVAEGPVSPQPPLVSAEFLGASTILRSLILFNLLFAAQSILDGIYLWGHAALPDNMTYAAYAHRGAYPLIATALLAAAFVLVAMRPGGPAEKSKVVRAAGLSLGRAERAAGRLLHPPARSLCRHLHADLLADCSVRLDGTGSARPDPDRRAHRARQVQSMADRRQSRRIGDRALWLLARELRRLHRRLQCRPQPGSFGKRRADRHRLSPDARAAGGASHRQGDRATARRQRGLPCVAPRPPCRTAASGPGLAKLGLSQLATPAQAGRRGESSGRQPAGELTRTRRVSWRIAFSSSTTKATSARSSASP